MVEVCCVMWGQSYVAVIFTLLLHKWLLQNNEAGGKPQRHKYFNVLLTGCRQLFWIDIHSCAFRFQSIFGCVHESCISSDLPFKNSFLCLIGQFLPYYHAATEVNLFSNTSKPICFSLFRRLLHNFLSSKELPNHPAHGRMQPIKASLPTFCF